MDFTTRLIEAASGMFKSRLFSTGGDEVNARCYSDDPETQQALQRSGRTLEQALDVFTQSTHGVLRNAGKTPVVWEGAVIFCVTIKADEYVSEEMVLSHNVTLSSDTVIM